VSWSERIAALPPRTLAVAAGLAGVVIGLASGTLPVVLASYAVIVGARVISAVAGWLERITAVDTTSPPSHEKTRDELLAEVRAFGSRLEGGPETGIRRFQERVSAVQSPGRNRLH
jgi:hypothetical protein